jgi:hypothetical protein
VVATGSLLEAIRGRRIGHKGIVSASAYLMEGIGCRGAACLGVSESQWLRTVKEAEQRLTYHHPKLRVREVTTAPSTPRAILSFDCVLSATSKDRDGDVLESKGAEIDRQMPLLWQHLPMEPIGRLLSVLVQNEKRIVCRFAIADTQLGRDAAVLVEFGAVRMSHGFHPKKWEPLLRKRDEMASQAGHWVQEWTCLEGSLVSVPSNTEAVILAYSREKLTSPLMKHFAGTLYLSRPVMVKSGWDGASLLSSCSGRCKQGLDPLVGKLLARLLIRDLPKPKHARGLVALVQRTLASAPTGSSPTSCGCFLFDGADQASASVLTRRLAGGLALGIPVPASLLRALSSALVQTAIPVQVVIRPSVPERGTPQYRRCAYHEAGHAVYAVLLGLQVQKAAVGKAAGGGRWGVVLVEKDVPLLTPAELIVFELIGSAAEHWLGAPDQVGGTDKKRAREVFKQLTSRKVPQADLDRLARDLSQAFRSDPWLGAAIKAVANLLEGCKGGQLPGDQVVMAVRDTCGEHFDETALRLRSTANALIRDYVDTLPREVSVA